MPALLSATTVRALNGPTETDLRSLLAEYGYSEAEELLQGLGEILNVLNEFGISCSPPLGSGDLDAPRVLASRHSSPIGAVLSEIEKGEASDLEFKSSLLVDTKKLAYNPGKPIQEYKSEGVTRSALKTVAAFSNSGGGMIYFGVADDASICGLEEDFAAANANRRDYDGWDLHFRNLISSRFSDGPAMNRYVQTQCYKTEDGRQFVRVSVAARTRLTFLKTGDAWELFVRSGTQTNSIPYAEIEHHFMLTPLY